MADFTEQYQASTSRPRGRRYGWLIVLLVLVVAGGATAWRWQFGGAHQAAAQPAAMPPPAVTVSAPLQRDVMGWTRFTGQFSAVDQVDLRAQVTGYLTEIHFTDGQMVHKGDLLFVIDPRPYQIQLEQAVAQYQSAQAQLRLADRQLQRTAQLTKDDFESRDNLDQRIQADDAAKASIAAAQAAIHSAQLNLEFTHITAPFGGRIGAHQLSIGNLVSGGPGAVTSTMLATIVSLDPIHLDFDMSESDYLDWSRYEQERAHDGGPDRTVQASLSDEHGWPRIGTLDFVDNQLDRGSGTLHARASFPNADLLIAPGEFANLRVPTSATRPVLLVPDLAVITDQSTKLVMTVAPDGTVVPKLVKTGELTQGLRVITAGLTPNDKVIIDGLVRARPGTKVTPQQGSIKLATN
jgi:RND family efflux transporter MFP subunit